MKIMLMTFILALGSIHAQTLSPQEFKIIEQDAMKLWQKRDVLESLEECLGKLELMHSAQPEQFETLGFLSRGNYLMGDGHMDDPEMKKRYFEKAALYGEMALATNKEYKKRMEKDLPYALEFLTLKEVPALYWTAVSLDKLSRLSGMFVSFKHKDKIVAFMKRAEKLRPDYFHGGIPRFWATQDGELKHFQKSLEMAPEYLGTRVAKAEFYWTKKEDKHAFRKELETAMAMPSDKDPTVTPENMLEQRKAEKLLKRVKEFF